MKLNLSCKLGALFLVFTFVIAPDATAETRRKFPILERIKERRASSGRSTGTPVSAAQPVGFSKVTTGAGLKIALWYPSDGEGRSYKYGARAPQTVIIEDGAVRAGKYPLIVFSHGFHGCGVQSVFLTEALARAGYIVAAPDHQDASCGHGRGGGGDGDFRPQEKFREPEKWSDATHADRNADLRAVIEYVLASAAFAAHVDPQRIGVAGHSLGGYTVLGAAGAWESWRDNRIKAVLALSPEAHAFEIEERIKGVRVPVMYQGADRDMFITPLLNKEGGIYDLSNTPKYFLQLKKQGHFAWSNAGCRRYDSVDACVAAQAHMQLINAYSIAFFDQYLKGEAQPLLREGDERLTDYRYEH